MSNLNSIILEGTLVRDPLLRHTQKGSAICCFAIENRRFFRDSGGLKKESSIFDVEVFGKLGEQTYAIVKKKRGIRVVGRLKQERWDDDDGRPRGKTTIIAEHVDFKPALDVKITPQKLTCDRCGIDITEDWYNGQGPATAGNCTDCGDNLCKDCAKEWDDDGRCLACQEKEKQNANV